MIINRTIRFFQIDTDYLQTNKSFSQKLSNIIRTDFIVLLNLLLRKRKFTPISLSDKKIYYDTPFATKTFFAAVYDFYVVTKKTQLFNKNPIIVDIGANIGQFLFACKTFFPNAKVYCFEPDPEIYTILQKNASQYKKVFCSQYALSSEARSLSFYKSNAFSEWSSLVKPTDNLYSQIKIKAKKGDQLLNRVGKIDLLKIDVEGAEYEVIKGLTKTLHNVKYLLIEVSLDRETGENSTAKMLSYLLTSGFTIFRIGRLFTLRAGERQGAVDILFKNTKYE